MGNIEELDKKIEKMLKKSEAILSAGADNRRPMSLIGEPLFKAEDSDLGICRLTRRACAGLCQRGPCSFRIERIKLGD